MVLLLCLMVPVQAYHIPTVSEGLLSEQGCYVGAYLGGNQGANDPKSVNFFMKAQPNPYETQYLDQPADYGEKKGRGISGIDTGISSFHSDLDAIQPGSLFSPVFRWISCQPPVNRRNTCNHLTSTVISICPGIPWSLTGLCSI